MYRKTSSTPGASTNSPAVLLPGTHLAQTRRVRWTFDRDTVLVTDVGDHVDLAVIPGVLWDARVGQTGVDRCGGLLSWPNRGPRASGLRTTPSRTAGERRACLRPIAAYHICYTGREFGRHHPRTQARRLDRSQGEGITPSFHTSDEARNRHRSAPKKGRAPWHAREDRASSARSVEVNTCTTPLS